MAYWDFSSYLGIGAGAHSYLSNKKELQNNNVKESKSIRKQVDGVKLKKKIILIIKKLLN